MASIGLVAGAGFPLLAVCAAILTLVTLVVLGWFEKTVLDPNVPR